MKIEQRLIEFRAWYSKENIFIDFKENGYELLIGLNGFPVIYHETDKILKVLEKKNYVFQQFTGLIDKNGKKIFEGDILYWTAEQMMKNNTPIYYSKNYKAVVRYSPPSFGLEEINDMPVFWSGAEIIGDIFQNPELLNK